MIIIIESLIVHVLRVFLKIKMKSNVKNVIKSVKVVKIKVLVRYVLILKIGFYKKIVLVMMEPMIMGLSLAKNVNILAKNVCLNWYVLLVLIIIIEMMTVLVDLGFLILTKNV